MTETTPSPLNNVIGSFSFWPGCGLATSKSARFGADSPCLFVRKILYVINSSPTPALRKVNNRRVIYELVLAIAPEINYSVGCI